jgi:hypothetical protein
MAEPDKLEKLEDVKPAKTPQELDFRRQRLQEVIEMTHSSLADIAAEDIPTIQERIFVQVFLPIFAGDEVNQYKAKIYPHWINVAGNPYRPVNVVDTQGKVLFTVPALLDRRAISPSTQTERGTTSSISHVVASASQYSAMSPIAGANYLSKELTRRALIMKVPTQVLTDLKTWNEIFVRYGRPPLAPVPSDVAPQNAAGSDPKSDTGGVEFDFE